MTSTLPRYIVSTLSPTAVSATGTAGNDSIDGSDVADNLSGNDGNDTVNGFGGDDYLFGNNGNDSLSGGGGNDHLTGGLGNDTLLGGAGDDVLHGGNDDIFHGDGGDDALYGEDGNDTLSGSGNTLLDGGAGNDVLNAEPSHYGTFGNATLEGGAGNDSISTGAGNDVVHAGSGDDTVRIGLNSTDSNAYHLTIDGGDGADAFFLGSSGNAIANTADISGGAGRDTYHWLAGGPQTYDAVTVKDFQAGAGGDVLDVTQLVSNLNQNAFAAGYLRVVASGADTLLQFDADGPQGSAAFGTLAVLKGVAPGTLTADNFTDGLSPDGSSTGLTLQGTAGNDVIQGGIADDTIHGGAGDDTIDGGRGVNWLYGDDGNDDLRSGYGNAHLDGGSGDDYLSSYSRGGDTLAGGLGNDFITVQDGNNKLDGGDGNDQLTVFGKGNNILLGGSGDDTMDGGTGDDTFDGGAGLDLVNYYYDISDIANVDVTHDAAGWHIGDKPNSVESVPIGHDTLRDIERVGFAGQMLALDTDGIAGEAYRLYRAAFDRTPDVIGLGYWIGRMDQGLALVDTATSFVASQEFSALYGAAPSNADLVTHLYANILHRAPEQAGYDYWLNVLDTHRGTVAQVLAAFSESAENHDGTAALIANGIVFTPYHF